MNIEEIRIYCENTGAYHMIAMGTALKELSQTCVTGFPVLAALVDNKLKALDYKVINPHNIRPRWKPQRYAHRPSSDRNCAGW